MKILHIVPTYNPAFRRGGPIVSVHNLNKWLVRKGVDVTVYTTDIDTDGKAPIARISKDGLENELILDGVKVYFFKHSFPRVWEYWRVGFVPAFLPRHWEYSKDLHGALIRNTKNFDLVHATSTFLFASILGAHYAKKFKKPYIISPRGNLMEPLELKGAAAKKMYIRLFEKEALRDAVIHCTVPAEKEHYKRHKLPLRDSIVIPNGVEEEEFFDSPEKGYFRKKFNIGDDEKMILFLGRINWKKGLDTLIPAFAEVVKKEPRVVLVIAGADDDGYKKKIECLIREHPILISTNQPDRHKSAFYNVIFTDMLLGKDKLGALKDADVFVLPSYSENFGMAVVEAMRMSVPVVVTRYVGISPYLTESGAGIVVDKDENELSEAILKVLGNITFAKEIGEKGRKLIQEKFAMPMVADQFFAAYNKIIKSYEIRK